MVAKFKALRPKPLKPKAFRQEWQAELDKIGRGIDEDFKAGIATWSDPKPTFVSKVTGASAAIILTVVPGGPAAGVKKYTYVHEGTDPHIIRPVQAQKLRFRGTYTAKTTPGVIRSHAGGSSGSEIFADEVAHPGSKGRPFTDLIQKKWARAWVRRMKRVTIKANKAAGHAI